MIWAPPLILVGLIFQRRVLEDVERYAVDENSDDRRTMSEVEIRMPEKRVKDRAALIADPRRINVRRIEDSFAWDTTRLLLSRRYT